ncbi:MAG: phosphotransferase system, cellobiose specific, component [Bacillota bacterium]|jgi:PTS system cellobiose-specific IIC component|nr:phosphotransferase system, cellobiose specific, component [Bacillota bacterium]
MKGILTNNFFEEKFMPIAARIGNQRHLLALRDGIMFSMPLLIIGSLFIILAELPIDAYQNFMASVFGDNWNAFEGAAANGTIGIIALISAFGVAYSLASSYAVDGKNIDGIPAGVLSVASYLIVNIVGTFGTGDDAVEAWRTDIFSSQYLFVALVVAIVTAEIYRTLLQKKLVITLPKTVPPTVARSFTALIPGIIITVFFLLVRLGFAFTPWADFATFIQEILKKPISAAGSSYLGTLVACLVEHFLWAFGIHGSSIMTSVMEPVWLVNAAENLEAFKSGATKLPHIVTYTFYENGVWMGGSGATLSVVVYMLIFAKSKLVKQVGRLSIVPGLFNINEPVVFGLPIVLNPFLMIPYIISPVVVMTIMYFGTALGIFPYTTGVIIPWTTPYFISGYLMTGGKIGGVIMEMVAFLAAFAVWFPFIRIWDKKNYNLELASGE